MIYTFYFVKQQDVFKIYIFEVDLKLCEASAVLISV